MSEQSMVIPISSSELERALEERVLAAGSLAGAKLESERALAEEFGVGRPLVREVLRRLEERGLITIMPGRGAFVHDRPPTQGGGSVELLTRRGRITPRQLIVARSMLESEAAALAAAYRAEADLARMADSLTVLSSAGSEAAKIDADVQFHEAIAIASGNTVLQIMFGSIRPHIRGIVARSLSDVVVRDLALPSHGLIHAAIRDGDGAAARAAMLDHLNVATQLYGDDLDRPLRDVLARRDLSPVGDD